MKTTYRTAVRRASLLSASLLTCLCFHAAAQTAPAMRIGIAMPKYEMGGGGGLNAGEPIRTAEQQLLTAPGVEVVRLRALLPAQAAEEAKLLKCDYVLTSAASVKAKTGGFGLRGLSSLAPMTNVIPGGGLARSVATTSAVEAISLGAMASDHVKARSEVSFEYTLSPPSGEPVAHDVLKAKATADGEDLLTPMLQQAATRIFASVGK